MKHLTRKAHSWELCAFPGCTAGPSALLTCPGSIGFTYERVCASCGDRFVNARPKATLTPLTGGE